MIGFAVLLDRDKKNIRFLLVLKPDNRGCGFYVPPCRNRLNAKIKVNFFQHVLNELREKNNQLRA